MARFDFIARPWLLMTLGATAVVLVYLPGLYGGFIFDDFPNIVNNDDLKIQNLTPAEILGAMFSRDSAAQGRPLAMLTFGLERYFAGLNPTVMKTTNLFVHLINACLIFILIRRLVRFESAGRCSPFVISNSHFACLVAILWALAPINLTGVLYVVQRMESLAALAILAGLIGYVSGRVRLAHGKHRALPWLWGSIVGGVSLGTLFKETAVMLPVYALVIEVIVFRFGTPWSAERRHLIQLFIITLIVPAIAGLAWLLPQMVRGEAFSPREFSVIERVWTQPRVLWHYIHWILMPTPTELNLYHDDIPVSRSPLTPWTTLPATVGIAAVALCAWFLRRRLPWVSFGVFWFFVMHLLVSSILQLELVHEHRNYLGSLGLILAVVALLLDRRYEKMLVPRGALIFVLLSSFTMTTAIRSEQWGHPLRLRHIQAQTNPDSERAQFGFAKLLLERADGPQDPLFSMGIERLNRLITSGPSSIAPWQAMVLAHAYHGLEVKGQWWVGMEDHLKRHPLGPTDRSAVARLLNAVIEDKVSLPHDRIERLLDTAIAESDDSSRLRTIKANYLLNVRDKLQRGYKILKSVTIDNPGSVSAWKNLVRHQVIGGYSEAARASLSRVKELNYFGLHTAFIKSHEEKVAGIGNAGTGDSGS